MPHSWIRPIRRRLPGALCALLIGLGSVLASAPAAASAASPEETVAGAIVSPTVFEPDGDGVRDAAVLAYQLVRDATVEVAVVDYLARPIRLLQPATPQPAGAYQLTWDGLDDLATLVPDAGYRFRLTALSELGTFTIERPVTKAASEVFPAAPGSITVALDPGHGGNDPGAGTGGLLEKTVNLDIALRLKAMLVGAGVNVVMTREQDRRVNLANVDWSGDGSVGARDELASRIEVANQAAADVFLVIHNNSAPQTTSAGTETWYTVERPWAAENRLLATDVQSGLVSRLRTLALPGFRSIDRGIRRVKFYVNAPYHSKLNPRPSLMPTVLAESLFVTNVRDRAALRNELGRQAVAAGYYEALARYFASRAVGARYALVTPAPPSVMEGQSAVTQVSVTNTSPSFWAAGSVALTVAAVPTVRFYDGTSQPGTVLGSAPLPVDLGPGQSVVVDLPFAAPAFQLFASRAGATLLKFDLASSVGRFELRGVVPLQVPFVVTADPTKSPPPAPAPAASPTPTPNPGPTPTPLPTDPGAIPTPTPLPTDPGATPTPPIPTPTPTPSSPQP